MRIFFFIILLLCTLRGFTQHPFQHYTEAIGLRYSSKQPVVHYYMKVDTATAELRMRMRISGIRDSFQVAMAVHPEYDDRYYRFIKNMEVNGIGVKGSITQSEPTRWQVYKRGEEVEINYTIQMPRKEANRGAWRASIGANGALIGGPHSFLYLPDFTLAPSYVYLELPAGWKTATGLEATADPSVFFAPTIHNLMESPVLAGYFNNHSFEIAGVPHNISFLGPAGNNTVDLTNFYSGIKKIVTEAAALFGRLPYKEYHFLIQDEAYGGLEHHNSVTIGIDASRINSHLEDYLGELAHEYFHTWNLVRIRPAEYGDVSHRQPQLSKGLWWSEGLTMYYADLLMRRAGLKKGSRTDHLKELIIQYYTNPAHHSISAEKLSMAAYAGPGYLGIYDGSTHVQGELIGNLIDFIIRDATDGKKSIDHLMRAMMNRYSGKKGFTGKDIENLVREISGAGVRVFFDDHIRGNKSINLNKYLHLAGMQTSVAWKSAVDKEGKPLPDRRVWVYENEGRFYFDALRYPQSAWSRAGLQTGDELVSVNGKQVGHRQDFYQVAGTAGIDDVITLGVRRAGKLLDLTVTMTGYEEASVSLADRKEASKKALLIRELWLNGSAGLRL